MNYSAARDERPHAGSQHGRADLHNERDGLTTDLVTALFDTATRFGLRLEVIIVDDGSPDGTGQLADDLARPRT